MLTLGIAGDTMTIVDLPDGLHENILRFLSVHSPDHLSLAFTCRQLLQEVKSFSKKKLDRISREHDVDDDWLYRAGMQAVVASQQEAGWYISSSVSQRRMLRSAYRTHIHSLGTDLSHKWTGILCLAMHPDGKRILSGGNGREGDSTIVRLWDVQAKRCIRSFVGHSISADSVSFSAGSAISQAWEDNNLRIWDLNNGTCRHSVEVYLGIGKHAASNEEVFVPNLGDEDGVIDAINIHTGVIRSSPRQSWCTHNVPSIELHLCGDFLLAAASHHGENYENEEATEQSARKAGIYVLDRSSLELMNHVTGVYKWIKIAANGDVVSEKTDGSFDVFQLDDDRLAFRTSFQRRPSSALYDFSLQSILLVHNSRAYVNSRGGPNSCIEVYNILTGELERTLWYPSRRIDSTLNADCLVAGKKELYCGFNCGGSMPNVISAIKVYLLD
jgi:WD40 repeat protein